MANIRAKLKAYRAKRDFSKTGEPTGRLRVAQQNARRFVIQKHAASRLHYDFRLEIDGVLKSWLSQKALRSILRTSALQSRSKITQLITATSKATIPKGQYGGGTVMLWDRGTWERSLTDAMVRLRSSPILRKSAA